MSRENASFNNIVRLVYSIHLRYNKQYDGNK